MHHGEGLSLDCRMPAANRTTAFGRLFEKQVEQLSDIELADIGRGGGPIDTGLLLQAPAGPPPPAVIHPIPQNSTRISAGFTFLGQFIDHDMTFMETVPALGQVHDLANICNRRSPFLNLDSVYGDGPTDEGSRRFYDAAGRFLVGGTPAGTDLPRDSGGIAIIADPRNDENLIISQIHLVFLRLHNVLADALVGAGTALSSDEFAVVQRRVVRRWQFICLQRYLPTIVDKALIDALLTEGTPHFEAMVRSLGEIAVPVEFAVAAFRFGHSQVRDGYSINNEVALPLFNPNGRVNPIARRSDLSGRKPVVAASTVDFARFFTNPSLDEPLPPTAFNPAMQIDAQLSSAVFRLPRSAINAPPVSLAERNLRRGAALELPSGQAVAIALGCAGALLTPAQLRSVTPDPDATQQGVVAQQRALSDAAVRNTPLWFYILKEAEVLEGGNKLGPVGQHIVGETFIGLLRHDPNSLINLPGHIGKQLADISPNDPADPTDAVLPASYDVLDLIGEAVGGATQV